MKKICTALSVVTIILFSCSSENSVVGDKYYVLDIKIDAISIAEYELNFISSDKVEMKSIIYCNSLECLTKENSPAMFEKTVIKNYNNDNGELKIEGIPDLQKIIYLPSGDIKSSNGEVLYKTSITQVDNNEKSERVVNFFKGNKALGKVFTKLLYNKAPKPLIEKTADGRLKFNK